MSNISFMSPFIRFCFAVSMKLIFLFSLCLVGVSASTRWTDRELILTASIDMETDGVPPEQRRELASKYSQLVQKLSGMAQSGTQVDLELMEQVDAITEKFVIECDPPG